MVNWVDVSGSLDSICDMYGLVSRFEFELRKLNDFCWPWVFSFGLAEWLLVTRLGEVVGFGDCLYMDSIY